MNRIGSGCTPSIFNSIADRKIWKVVLISCILCMGLCRAYSVPDLTSQAHADDPISFAAIYSMAFSSDSRTLVCFGSEAVVLTLVDRPSNRWASFSSSEIALPPRTNPFPLEDRHPIAIRGNLWEYSRKLGPSSLRPIMSLSETQSLGSEEAARPTPPEEQADELMTIHAAPSLNPPRYLSSADAVAMLKSIPFAENNQCSQQDFSCVLAVDAATSGSMMAWTQHCGDGEKSLLFRDNRELLDLGTLCNNEVATTLSFTSGDRFLAFGAIGLHLIDLYHQKSIWNYYSELTHGVVRVTALALSPDESMLAVAMSPGISPDVDPRNAPAILIFDISSLDNDMRSFENGAQTVRMILRHNLHYAGSSPLLDSGASKIQP